MTAIIIGEKEFEAIEKLFLESACNERIGRALESIEKNLYNILLSLYSDPDKANEVHQMYSNKMVPFDKVLIEGVRFWANDKGSQATLERLGLTFSPKVEGIVDLLAEEIASIESAPVPVVEWALSHPDILEPIFERMDFETQRKFRLVNKRIWEGTLAIWRKTKIIKVYDRPYSKRGKNYTRMKWEDFCDVLEIEKLSNGEEIENNFLQMHYPYRKICLRRISLFNPVTKDQFFWNFYGSYITHLELYSPLIDQPIISPLVRLVLEACPNLSLLKTSNLFTRKGRKQQKNDVFNITDTGGKCNMNLKTLEIRLETKGPPFQQLLKFTPALKRLCLTLCECQDEILEGLLSPAANGQYIKLEELVFPAYSTEELDPLKNYLELPNNTPSALKHLSVSKMILDSDIEIMPVLLSILKHTSKSLEHVELSFICHLTENEYILDLSGMMFPKLKFFSFQTISNQYQDVRTARFKFDLRNVGDKMRNLKELNIYYNSIYLGERMLRKPGAEDWTMNDTVSIPSCTTLKRFQFYGWPLTSNDIALLKNWFPCLKLLKAQLSSETDLCLDPDWNDIKYIPWMDRQPEL